MDTIGILHLLGIGLLLAGGALAAFSGQETLALISLTLAVILGFSVVNWRSNDGRATEPNQ
jgi:hypothetical protein